MESSPNEICAIIAAQLEQSRYARGSALGSVIHATFPQVDLRARYRGLRQLISDHCGDEIVWVGKQGGDDLYRHRDAPAENILPSRPVGHSAISLWHAFTNPNIPLHVAIDPEAKHIFVTEPSASLPESAISIGKLDSQFYRNVAQEFLDQIDEEVRPEFQATLELQEFWGSWSQLLTKYKASGILTQWNVQREQAIRRELEARIGDSRIPSAESGDIIGRIISSRFQSNSERAAHEPGQSVSGTHSQRKSQRELRILVRLALDSMSEEDIGRIWLPVGKIWDALDK